MRTIFNPFVRSSKTKYSLNIEKSSSNVSSLCGITSVQFSFAVIETGVFINLKLVALSLFVNK